MNPVPGARAFVVRWCRRLIAEGRRRWLTFGVLWRRSLQVRVVVSTLALSAAVVFVLGMVLQNEIIDRLVSAKQQAAIAQTGVAQRTVSTELRGMNSSTDNPQARLAGALAQLTSTSAIGGSAQAAGSSAGAFVPVLARVPPACPRHRSSRPARTRTCPTRCAVSCRTARAASR